MTDTCNECGAENVPLGWAQVCRPCWDAAAHHDAFCPRASDCTYDDCEHWPYNYLTPAQDTDRLCP